VVSLKVKLLTKILRPDFQHAWKSIVTNQFRNPGHIIVSIETSGVNVKYKFTEDLLSCFAEWKTASAAAREGSINHCVWANKAITDVGSKLWNEALISQGVYYQFLDNVGNILPYNQFKTVHNIRLNTISSTDYVAIKLGIRRYNNPSDVSKSISTVSENLCLKFLMNGAIINTKIGSKAIRNEMCKRPHQSCFVQLDRWVVSFSNVPSLVFDWHAVFYNLYCTTNNYKLIQHQYKILMKIATSKYLRYKMKIENNYNCDNCVNQRETLEHIYLECPKTLTFLAQVEEHIRARIDESYSDHDKLLHFTCNHTNKAVNYVNLVAKWFIGRQFQNHKPLYFDAFEKFVDQFLTGEKQSIKVVITGTGSVT
jgi:hypothetical protein